MTEDQQMDQLAAERFMRNQKPVTVSESRAALIEAQKALTCAKRKIDEVLGRTG